MNLRLATPLIVFTLFACVYLSQKDRIEAYFQSGPINIIDEVGTIPLVRSEGGVTNLRALSGKYLVVFFGYTSCPDVCPLSLSYAAREYRQLAAMRDQVDVVFVSVDPERDQADKLGNYARHFDQDFIGVTAEPAAIKEFSEGFTAGFSKNESTSALGYLMTHSSDFFIIDPDGRLVRRIHPPHEPGTLRQALINLIGTFSS